MIVLKLFVSLLLETAQSELSGPSRNKSSLLETVLYKTFPQEAVLGLSEYDKKVSSYY